ncbi:MAG: hypothetical protein IJ747_02840 [Lachnospiraceae bacterium]|nr:hypothetical protein [Lachnospiraceae bacterium]
MEFERLIPKFLKQDMDYLTLQKFSEHMDSCSECREELVIQFLVTEGLQRLEEGDAFDLQTELDVRCEEMKNRLKYTSVFLYLGAGLELIVIASIVGFLVWMFL